MEDAAGTAAAFVPPVRPVGACDAISGSLLNEHLPSAVRSERGLIGA
ncbi:hypothetical protein ABT061_38905 [Streptosporangium sp. NPDC002544]